MSQRSLSVAEDFAELPMNVDGAPQLEHVVMRVVRAMVVKSGFNGGGGAWGLLAKVDDVPSRSARQAYEASADELRVVDFAVHTFDTAMIPREYRDGSQGKWGWTH